MPVHMSFQTLFFFFKQKTAYEMRISDWSSDVCSSDLVDLVVTDIRLTGTRSGIDVAQMAHDRGMAVMFATAFCPAEAMHLAIGCLAKPFAQRDLLTAHDVADALLRGEKAGRVPIGIATCGDRVCQGV